MREFVIQVKWEWEGGTFDGLHFIVVLINVILVVCDVALLKVFNATFGPYINYF